jgi:hypothetical protein
MSPPADAGEDARAPATNLKPNNSSNRLSQKSKDRRFFQQMQPTFATELPTTTSTTRFEFLDENDPAKKTIIRKKAREWVNKNKITGNHNGQKQQRSRSSKTLREADDGRNDAKQSLARPSNELVVMGGLIPQGLGSYQSDSFNILPDIGRKYGHIVDFCES